MGDSLVHCKAMAVRVRETMLTATGEHKQLCIRLLLMWNRKIKILEREKKIGCGFGFKKE